MTTKVHEFVLGGAERARLAVRVSGRLRAYALDGDDGNWLQAAVEIHCGKFAGGVTCSLRTDDFADFRTALARLTDNRSATAVFKTMEDQLGIQIKGDGRGAMQISGHVSDAIDGNRLAFSFVGDAGGLPAVLSAIDALLEAYPVR
jgi:hypothetical protein